MEQDNSSNGWYSPLSVLFKDTSDVTAGSIFFKSVVKLMQDTHKNVLFLVNYEFYMYLPPFQEINQ